jgi:octopine/nopaline transport system substrate-binding protein
MNIMTSFALAVIAALLAGGTAAAQDRIIKIATEGAYAPWNFTGAGGKLEGFDIDLANELCNRIKVKCEIVAQDWDGIIPALQAKKYDAIMAGMSITDERKQVIDFAGPYADSPNGYLVAKDSPIAKMPGTGKTYNLVSQQAEAEKAIEATKPVLKGTAEIREYKTTEAHDLDLLAGRIDAVLADATAIIGTLDKPEFKDYTLVGPAITGGIQGDGVGIGLRKEDTELKQKLNEAIRAATQDGTIQKLSMKWFKINVAPKS